MNKQAQRVERILAKDLSEEDKRYLILYGITITQKRADTSKHLEIVKSRNHLDWCKKEIERIESLLGDKNNDE